MVEQKDVKPGEQAILRQLQSILIAGETLEAWALQLRIFALTHRRTLVAATSGRFIVLRRRLLGGFDPIDVRWQDLKEVRINVGLLSAELTLTAYDGADLSGGESTRGVWQFTGLHKSLAQEVYRICQACEQAWREKRRIRDIEEMRARAGGIQLTRDAVGSEPPAAAENGELVQRLKRAKEMLDARLISDSEYEALKAKIINQA